MDFGPAASGLPESNRLPELACSTKSLEYDHFLLSHVFRAHVFESVANFHHKVPNYGWVYREAVLRRRKTLSSKYYTCYLSCK